MTGLEAWAACLDEFDAHLTSQFDALTMGAVDGFTAFAPPPQPDPLPSALLPRARELEQRAHALARAVEQERDRTGAALDRLRRPVTDRAESSFVDSRG